MHTLIIGNSNSILSDGWTRPLRHLRPDDTWVNISLGGSPSPALLHQIISRKDARGGFDLVILEPTVVDHGEGWMNPDQIAGQAHALLEVLKASCARVVLLILPRTAEYARAPSRGMLAWAAMAHRLSVPIIDARRSVIAYAQQVDAPLESMWRDNVGHLTAEAQQAVAATVNSWMNEANLRRFDLQLPHDLPWRVVTGAELAGANNLPFVSRATSLIQVDCLSLCAGDRFVVPLHVGEAVLGLSVNYGELDPTETLHLVTEPPAPAPPRVISLENKFLTNKISRKLALMFKKIDIPTGCGVFSFPDIPAHSRLDRSKEQRLEIASLLIGRPIQAIKGWSVDGELAINHPLN